MPSSKRSVFSYKGENFSQRGDIEYFDGNNWVRLNIGANGYILVVEDIGGGVLEPRWELFSEALDKYGELSYSSSSSI